ncbi:hypothetical protein GGD65_004070 [Bradyrhizobium sp. CIR18]|nr:hypothetical protein [Bradyrhizobium sp. CIR18]NYG45247.1 hypothetical protein [Bradyrhizobium sp. IAR9]
MDRLPDFRIRQVQEDAKEDRYGRKALLAVDHVGL